MSAEIIPLRPDSQKSNQEADSNADEAHKYKAILFAQIEDLRISTQMLQLSARAIEDGDLASMMRLRDLILAAARTKANSASE